MAERVPAPVHGESFTTKGKQEAVKTWGKRNRVRGKSVQDYFSKSHSVTGL